MTIKSSHVVLDNDTDTLWLNLAKGQSTVEMIKDVYAALNSTEANSRINVLRINGVGNMAVAFVIAERFIDSVPVIAVYVPELVQYIIVRSASRSYKVGELII